MKCDKCGSDRIIKFEAKCSDGCFTFYKGKGRRGYYLCPAICLECGKVQGEFPKPEPLFDSTNEES